MIMASIIFRMPYHRFVYRGVQYMRVDIFLVGATAFELFAGRGRYKRLFNFGGLVVDKILILL